MGVPNPMATPQSTRKTDPNSLTARLIQFVEEHPDADSLQICKALDGKHASITSMLGQMATTGRLVRVPTGNPSNKGAHWAYRIGDMSAPTFPSARNDNRKPRPKRATIAKEIEAASTPDEIISKAKQLTEAMNGDHHPRKRPPQPGPELLAAMNNYATEAFTDDEPGGYVNQDPEPQERPQEAIQTPVPTPAPQEPEMALATPSEAPREPVTLFPIYRMIDSIAKTMATEIMYQLNVQLTAQVADMSIRLKREVEQAAPSPEALAARVANAVQPLKKRLPSVLVVGLRPQQAGLISGEFSEYFDLRFWADGEAVELLKHNAKGADHIVVYNNAISHATLRTLDSVNVNLIHAKGGLTLVRNKLTELYVQHADEQRAL